MTLIVGRIIENRIFIHSDSRITILNKSQNNPLTGLLKTIIVNPYLCYSFAGKVDCAEESVKRLYSVPIHCLDDFVSFLFRLHQEFDCQTDFVIASILDNKSTFFKISEGEIESGISTFWIGNFEGFKDYQSILLELDSEKLLQDRMYQAFQSVLDDGKYPNIGDFHILVSTSNHESRFLKYDIRTEIYVSEAQTIKPGECKALSLGTRVGGAHGLSYLVIKNPGFYGVAIHYTHGEFGILLCPRISFEPIKIINVDGQKFVSTIEKEFEISLSGFVRELDTRLKFI